MNKKSSLRIGRLLDAFGWSSVKEQSQQEDFNVHSTECGHKYADSFESC